MVRTSTLYQTVWRTQDEIALLFHRSAQDHKSTNGLGMDLELLILISGFRRSGEVQGSAGNKSHS